MKKTLPVTSITFSAVDLLPSESTTSQTRVISLYPLLATTLMAPPLGALLFSLTPEVCLTRLVREILYGSFPPTAEQINLELCPTVREDFPSIVTLMVDVKGWALL